MRPKFEVGEAVLLNSNQYPAKNGEFVVKRILEHQRIVHSQTGKDLGAGYIYQLHGVDASPADGWLESSLRKKHQPGELSFTDLMSSLSSPKLITHQT